MAKRVVIVTGAASGVGRAAAELFAEHGARVVVADVDEARGRDAVLALEQRGAEALFAPTDVSDAAQTERMAQMALDRWGSIDVLVNNAAATVLCNQHDRPVHELEEWVWDKMLAVCLKSVYLCSKSCLPAMMKQGSGNIINVTSVDAVLAEPGFDAYTAAKGGVISITRSMAAEYGGHGIRVNAISPGYVLTECQQDWVRSNPAAVAAVSQAHALGRMAEPREVAKVALFLASDHAGFMTGALVPVDGGFSAFKQAGANEFLSG